MLVLLPPLLVVFLLVTEVLLFDPSNVDLTAFIILVVAFFFPGCMMYSVANCRYARLRKRGLF